jgi:N-acetylmuramoyl-L-alanine amidase
LGKLTKGGCGAVKKINAPALEQESESQQIQLKRESAPIDKTATISYEGQDKEILYHLAHAEAGASSAEGIENVVWTVLNRVNSPQFPNSIAGVAYQPSQFANIGQPGNWSNNPNDFVKTIVDQAYEQYINHPESTHDALFFHGPGFGIDWSGSHNFLFKDETGNTFYK